MSTDPELLDYYKKLLIVQYRTKTKANQTVQLLANCALCDGLPQELQNCFDLDAAIGDQLTILGKIVGVERNVFGLDLEHEFFSFTRYSGTPASIGFGRYTDDPYSTDLFLRYRTTATYTMTDFELRTVIKLAIIYNNQWSSFANLKEALYSFFEGGIDIEPGMDWGNNYFNFTRYNDTPESNGFGRYADSPQQEPGFFRYEGYNIMGLIYNVETVYFKAFEAAKFLEVVPKPMGVSYEVNYI